MTDATPYAPPSSDPGDDGTLPGLMRVFAMKMAQQTDDMLPARVIAYDRAKNRATVQPIVRMVTTAGDEVSRAQIASVPVLQIGAGDFLLAFPVNPGDLGWIKASDRDVSLFLQGLDEAAPNTARMHSFQDGLFIPDRMREWSLDPADADRVVLTHSGGATRIAVGVDTIAITASAAVTVDAPAVTITSALTTVNGPVTVNGTLTATSVATAGGIVLETHRHTGVTTGAGTSGGPTP